jgi:RNA polymerase sigma factor (sigma-70 family)
VSDAALLERFVRRGDEAAFELLVWRHGPMVLGVCRRVLRHEQDAEDAFQATFLVLARKAAEAGRRGSLGGWLYTVAYRVALRARQRRAAGGPPAGLRGVKPAADARPGPADLLAADDLRSVLDEEIGALPEKYRSTFVLCYLEGKTNAEAAELLGCPKGTVLSRLARARERLRQRLSGRGVAPAALPLAALLAGHARPPADVSPVLVSGAAHLAGLAAAGQALAGAASPAALALAEELAAALSLAGLKKVGSILAILAAAGTGIAAILYAPAYAAPAAPDCRHGHAAAPGPDALRSERPSASPSPP